jgi:hypothetical protein
MRKDKWKHRATWFKMYVLTLTTRHSQQRRCLPPKVLCRSTKMFKVHREEMLEAANWRRMDKFQCVEGYEYIDTVVQSRVNAAYLQSLVSHDVSFSPISTRSPDRERRKKEVVVHISKVEKKRTRSGRGVSEAHLGSSQKQSKSTRGCSSSE